MKRNESRTGNKITIRDNGMVHMPISAQMRDFEIAELFEIILPTVKGKIKTLLKSRFIPNCSGGIVMGNSVIPEYFGLEIIIAVAFQIQSVKADIFRRWVISQIMKNDTKFQSMFIQLPSSDIFN